MQNASWDDLRYLLAIHRAGSYSAAARHLGVDDTTVSRRLKSLRQAMGTDLFYRNGDATLSLTQTGLAIVERAERMEREAEAIGQVLGEAKRSIIGTVRITSVPVIVNRVLVPALPPLHKAHPNLVIELVPDARDLKLTRREADLALRLARPTVGGARVVTRRIGTLTYGVFASLAVEDREAAALGWILYDDTMAHLPQSKWLARTLLTGKGHPSGLRVTDADSALEAAAAGLGMALLPAMVGARDGRLRAVPNPRGEPPLQREIWLLSHLDQRDQNSIRTAVDWIEGIRWA
jgi:DNA-binding transcriptional LysR family regulator